MFSYEICEQFKLTFFTEHLQWVLSKYNEQQKLFEGFANSCGKIVSPILIQKLINDFVVCKHCNETLLLVEDATNSSHGFGNYNYHVSKSRHTF